MVQPANQTFQPKVDAPSLPPLDLSKFKKGARYLLEKPFYADDTYIAEGELIEYDGIPNESMIPQNDEARNNLGLWLASKGGRNPELGDVIEETMKNRPREGGVVVVKPKSEIPLTGNINARGEQIHTPTKEPTVKHIPQQTPSRYVRPVAVGSDVPTPGSI